jgi:hypothetical protein
MLQGVVKSVLGCTLIAKHKLATGSTLYTSR